ncbi:Hypothetical predicted protein [Podarcis lilfordi]|uniref:Uncharacterized protein n=1 Tax=Podarcis lilfordi TaxID=74358 RepID=A0AA35KD08_9SAUR|nr:Hypothetical predicted protein [Podarcis lilfordi]
MLLGSCSLSEKRTTGPMGPRGRRLVPDNAWLCGNGSGGGWREEEEEGASFPAGTSGSSDGGARSGALKGFEGRVGQGGEGSFLKCSKHSDTTRRKKKRFIE